MIATLRTLRRGLRGITLAALVAALPACGQDAADDAAPETDAAPPERIDEGEPAPRARQAWVISRLEFGRVVSAGVSHGFDLDGRVSDNTDRESCRKPDYTAPDGTPGIDNQLAELIPALEQIAGDALDGLVQGAINDGALMMVVEQRDDGVALTQAAGVPFLGTDGFILADQTLPMDPEAPVAVTDGFEMMEMDEGTMIEAGPIMVPIPVDILNVHFTLNVRNGRFRFVVRDDGTMQGLMGGEIEVDEVIDAIDEGGVDSATNIARTVLNGRADMARDEDGKCHAFSAVLLFDAVPVYLADWE